MFILPSSNTQAPAPFQQKVDNIANTEHKQQQQQQLCIPPRSK